MRYDVFLYDGAWLLAEPDGAERTWLLTRTPAGFRIDQPMDGLPGLPPANMDGVPEEELIAAEVATQPSRALWSDGVIDGWVLGHDFSGAGTVEPETTDEWAGWLAFHIQEETP